MNTVDSPPICVDCDSEPRDTFRVRLKIVHLAIDTRRATIQRTSVKREPPNFTTPSCVGQCMSVMWS